MTVPYEVICSADDEEVWLAKRRDGIGSSDAGSLLGLNPYALKDYGDLDAVVRNFALGDPFKGNAATEAGKRFEHPIAMWFQDITGIRLHRFAKMIRNPAIPWLFCTPDYIDDDGYPYNIKLVGQNVARKWLKEIPEYNAVQSLIEQRTLGAPKGGLIRWTHGEEPKFHPIENDVALFDCVVSELERTWRTVCQLREEAAGAECAEKAA